MTLCLSIQCTAPNGETGSFIKDIDTGLLVSPIYTSCQYVFDWAKENGYVYNGRDPNHPVGTFHKPLQESAA